jgi:ferredoxin--NADP+ reductase
MYPILKKLILSEIVKMVVVEAPLVARKARPGQFVIVRIDETGERIPLTIADFDSQAGTITLIFQEVGKSTRQMGMLEEGQGFENIAGPLGHPSEIGYYGTVIMVGGGVGIAPTFPITRALKQAGNKVISIIGARNEALLFWAERMREYSDELIVCTDDGSCGQKGLVTGPLTKILNRQDPVNRVWSIGPAIMMKSVSECTRPAAIPTIVSLNTVMIDGTGMCGGCRVVLNQGAKFVCVDGPEFDGHAVDWNNMLARLSFYRTEEKEAMQRWADHVCQIGLTPSASDGNLAAKHPPISTSNQEKAALNA